MVVRVRFEPLSCPRCRSGWVRRSIRRNLLERAAAVLALPWRCDDCDRRFFALRIWNGAEPEIEAVEESGFSRHWLGIFGHNSNYDQD